MTPETVESVNLHIVDTGANVEDMRIAAMHHHSPLHNFLFDRDGKLLHANKAAVLACEVHTTGKVEDSSMQLLF